MSEWPEVSDIDEISLYGNTQYGDLINFLGNFEDVHYRESSDFRLGNSGKLKAEIRLSEDLLYETKQKDEIVKLVSNFIELEEERFREVLEA